MEKSPQDNTEKEPTVKYFVLGSAGIGSIEAKAHQMERLEEVTKRVGSGEFHAEIIASIPLPARCVDGRTPENGANPLAPNSAGGTESMFVADDLTNKRFGGKDGTTLQGYVNIIDELLGRDLQIGGHCDSHASGEKCGCGANDRLEDIYGYIAANSSALRDMASKIGVDIDNETLDLIATNAAERTGFSPASELFKELELKADESMVDRLIGEHNEVITVINMRHGTTLDRDALKAEFGENYQSLNVDAWSFEEAARVISESVDEQQQKVAAMVVYNLATAAVLTGPGMRVVVLE